MSKEKTEVEGNDLLDSFTWESENTFFGITKVNETEEQEEILEDVKDKEVPEKVDKPADTKEKETKEKEKEEEEEEELFADKGKQKSPEDEEQDAEDIKFYTTLSKELAEKGVFTNVDLTKVEEIDEEKFFELQEEEVEGRVATAIQDFAETLGNHETSKAFVTYMKAGGNPDKFFEFYAATRVSSEFSIDKESGQDAFLKYYYKNVEQLDDDDIEDKLDWLKESGKKQKIAEKYYSKYQEDEKAKREEFVAAQTAAQTAKENERKEFVTEIKTTLNDTESVNGIVFTKEDKSTLLDYILKPAVKLKNNQYLTQFQVELNELIKTDREKLLLLAKLLKTKFDTSGLTIQKETEAAKKIKSNLQSSKSKLASSAVGSKRKSIAEYF